MSVSSTVCGVQTVAERCPCHSPFRDTAFKGLATDANGVNNSAFNLPTSPWKLQVVLWQPVTAEFIEKKKEVHFFVNASDVDSVKAHLNVSRIPFRWVSFAMSIQQL